MNAIIEEEKKFRHKFQKPYIEEALKANTRLWGDDKAIAEIVRANINAEAKDKGLDLSTILTGENSPSEAHVNRTRKELEKQRAEAPRFDTEKREEEEDKEGGPGPGRMPLLPPSPTPAPKPTEDIEPLALDLSSVQALFDSANDLLGDDKVPQKRVNLVARFWQRPMNRLLEEHGSQNTDIILAFAMTALVFVPPAISKVSKDIQSRRRPQP